MYTPGVGRSYPRSPSLRVSFGEPVEARPVGVPQLPEILDGVIRTTVGRSTGTDTVLDDLNPRLLGG